MPAAAPCSRRTSRRIVKTSGLPAGRVVVVVVREQELQIVIDPITRRRSFPERRFNGLESILREARYEA